MALFDKQAEDQSAVRDELAVLAVEVVEEAAGLGEGSWVALLLSTPWVRLEQEAHLG